MLAKDSVCGETRGSGDWVFRGKGSAVVAAAAGSEDDGAGESYIFFKLSNSELGVGREPGKAAGPTTDKATAKGCLVAGGVSGAGVQVSFILSSKTLLNHCNEVFLSTSRSSAVMEQPSSGGGGRQGDLVPSLRGQQLNFAFALLRATRRGWGNPKFCCFPVAISVIFSLEDYLSVTKGVEELEG